MQSLSDFIGGVSGCGAVFGWDSTFPAHAESKADAIIASGFVNCGFLIVYCSFVLLNMRVFMGGVESRFFGFLPRSLFFNFSLSSTATI